MKFSVSHMNPRRNTQVGVNLLHKSRVSILARGGQCSRGFSKAKGKVIESLRPRVQQTDVELGRSVKGGSLVGVQRTQGG